jgi:L-lactate dehydrogenase complex protein LldG
LNWAAAGLSIARGPASANDEITLSRALAAVAETGTLLLASSADNPTTLAFLPETHLVVLGRATILGSFEEATALLRQTYGASLPRTVNFISGASRTGDIGGRIVHGAHGPRHLFVFITA